MKTMSLRECLLHYAERFKGREQTQQRMLLAQFVGVSHQSTALYWLRGDKQQPSGGAKWRAIGFFNLLGYSVAEYNNLRPEYQYACKALAYGLLDSQELGREFGYTGTNLSSRFYRVLETNGDLAEASWSRLQKFVTENQALIIEAESEQRRRYAVAMLQSDGSTLCGSLQKPAMSDVNQESIEPAAVVTLPSQPLGVEKRRPLGPVRQLRIQHVAQELAALQPLLQWLANDAQPSDREQFRDLLGARTVFDISNDLNHLCSETANKERGV